MSYSLIHLTRLILHAVHGLVLFGVLSAPASGQDRFTGMHVYVSDAVGSVNGTTWCDPCIAFVKDVFARNQQLVAAGKQPWRIGFTQMGDGNTWNHIVLLSAQPDSGVPRFVPVVNGIEQNDWMMKGYNPVHPDRLSRALSRYPGAIGDAAETAGQLTIKAQPLYGPPGRQAPPAAPTPPAGTIDGGGTSPFQPAGTTNSPAVAQTTQQVINIRIVGGEVTITKETVGAAQYSVDDPIPEDDRTDEQRRTDLDALLAKVREMSDGTRKAQQEAAAVAQSLRSDPFGVHGSDEWTVWSDPETFRAKRMHDVSLIYAADYCKGRGLAAFDLKQLGETILHVRVGTAQDERKTVWPCGRGWGMPGANRIWVYAETEERADELLKAAVRELLLWKLVKGPPENKTIPEPKGGAAHFQESSETLRMHLVQQHGYNWAQVSTMNYQQLQDAHNVAHGFSYSSSSYAPRPVGYAGCAPHPTYGYSTMATLTSSYSRAYSGGCGCGRPGCNCPPRGPAQPIPPGGGGGSPPFVPSSYAYTSYSAPVTYTAPPVVYGPPAVYSAPVVYAAPYAAPRAYASGGGSYSQGLNVLGVPIWNSYGSRSYGGSAGFAAPAYAPRRCVNGVCY